MIYLIDDKKDRQEKYFWTLDALKEYQSFLKPIWTYDEMADKQLRQDMFSENSIICLHESFFKNEKNRIEGQYFEFTRQKLVEHVAKKPKMLLIFFSGSISSRKVDKNVIYIPVSTFYKNLDVFLSKVEVDNINVNYLLYGKKPELEEEIRRQYVDSTNKIDPKESIALDTSNFFLQQNTIEQIIKKPLVDATEKLIGDDTSDSKLNKKITEWFEIKTYDNIFIPLCLGSTFADFSGLQLATLIRCTKLESQLSRIFIYSFLKPSDYLEDLMKHDCFNILKTKNVELIGYSKEEFYQAAKKEATILEISELPSELAKLNIKVPASYDDNHSIANEFGIFQLAYNAGIDIQEITTFDNEKLESLYFKWLIAKNGLLGDIPEEDKADNEDYRGKIKLKGLTILGKIDI